MNNNSDFSKENENTVPVESIQSNEDSFSAGTGKPESNFNIQIENDLENNFEYEHDEDAEMESEQPKKLRDRIKKMIPSLSGESYRFAVIAFTVFVAFLAAIRVFAIEQSVEFPGFSGDGNSYKLENTIYTTSFLILYVIGCVAAFVISAFSHKVSFGTSKRSNPFIFISSLAGFCMVGCAGFFVYRLTLIDVPASKMTYWVIILMLLTGAYFAMDAVGFITEKTRPWFSTVTVVFGIVRLISEFLKLHESQYLSSNEYHLVSLTAVLLFFCNNARFHIYGKAGIWYRFFGLFSVLTLLAYALPEIYISLFEPYYVDSVFVFCLVDAVLAFYIIAKLLSVRNFKSETEAEAEIAEKE